MIPAGAEAQTGTYHGTMKINIAYNSFYEKDTGSFILAGISAIIESNGRDTSHPGKFLKAISTGNVVELCTVQKKIPILFRLTLFFI